MKGSIQHVTFYPPARRGRRHRPLRVGALTRGLISQARYVSRFSDATRCRFFFNAAVLLKRRGVLRNRLAHGPLPRTIRRRAYEALFMGYV